MHPSADSQDTVPSASAKKPTAVSQESSPSTPESRVAAGTVSPTTAVTEAPVDFFPEIKQPEVVIDETSGLPRSDDPKDPSSYFPLADAGPYYVGLWSGLPNYGCPYCSYAYLAKTPEEGTGRVEIHILQTIDGGGVRATRHAKALEVKKEGDNS